MSLPSRQASVLGGPSKHAFEHSTSFQTARSFTSYALRNWSLLFANMFVIPRCGESGKWQLFTSLIRTKKYVTNEHKPLNLEGLAHYPLVISTSRHPYIHPKHEQELTDILRLQHSDKGQPIFDHFIKNWQKESISEDGKQLSGKWRVPSPDTDFTPAQWIPPPREGNIDPSAFDGKLENF